MDLKLSIIIATAGRDNLLDRTLQSIKEGGLPEEVSKIVIAENGPKGRAENTAKSFSGSLPIKYQHTIRPNKSYALNSAIAGAKDHFLIFFDDDIRGGSSCINAYVKAVKQEKKRHFYGGKCNIDNDISPPKWLRNYLPLSAKGWSQGETTTEFKTPEALGFNWGAWANDILEVGGFNEELGPGTPMEMGEETEVQVELLKKGITGLFLPQAEVWHNVPFEKCNPEWTIRRAYRAGRTKGYLLSKSDDYNATRSIITFRLKYLKFAFLRQISPSDTLSRKCFRNTYYEQLHKGCLDSLTGN